MQSFHQIQKYQPANNLHRINMSRLLLALFAILAIFSVSAMAGENCPKDEVWSNCGKECQPSCKNPTPICTDICVPGCVCKENLLRNDKGKCIPKCDC